MYPDWHLDAKCLGADTEEWFGPDDERRSMSPKQIKDAASLCDSCPAFAACLRSALENNEQYGVWAGTSGRVRKRIQAMLAFEVVTLDQVIEDYCNGERGKYERQSAKRDIDDDLGRRKEGVRLASAG